jgi:hypothetical protein
MHVKSVTHLYKSRSLDKVWASSLRCEGTTASTILFKLQCAPRFSAGAYFCSVSPPECFISQCFTPGVFHLCSVSPLSVSPPGCFTSGIFHLRGVSPPGCFTSRVFHLRGVSPLGCFTSGVFHLQGVSPPGCFTFGVFHLRGVSPPGCFTSGMFHLRGVSPPGCFTSKVFSLVFTVLADRPNSIRLLFSNLTTVNLVNMLKLFRRMQAPLYLTMLVGPPVRPLVGLSPYHFECIFLSHLWMD